MITSTGVPVMMDNDRSPTLVDIAVSLGRHPRFGGHTKRWWTVLHHSLVCGRIAVANDLGIQAKLYALLHDAHECVIGDIPTTWCIPEIRTLKAALDVRIYHKFKLQRTAALRRDNARIDRHALIAEAALYGPPGIMEYFEEGIDDVAFEIAKKVGEEYRGPVTTDGINSVGVRDYIREVEECLQ